MKDFMICVPTQIFFGKTALDNLASGIKQYGSRVLLVYGGGSIRKMGLYDKIVQILRENDIFFAEFGGVEANPKVSHLRKGIQIARENQVDVVLPVGGGSVIDEAKGIAGGYYYDGDVWELAMAGKPLSHKILPVLTVLTLAATGTEMSTGCNWTNDTIDPPVKKGFNGPDLRPRISFLNPENTYSVSPFQTAAGTADIMSHVFESYFTNVPGAYLQARTSEAILKTLVKYGPIAIQEPTNYEARANLMYAASWANNGLIVKGNPNGWAVHQLEHQLTAYNDTTHGDGLAILTPRWMRWVIEDEAKLWRFADLGINVFGLDPTLPARDLAVQTIEAVEDFFWNKLGLHSQLRQVGIPESMLETFADRVATPSGLKYIATSYRPMTRDDVLSIYQASY